MKAFVNFLSIALLSFIIIGEAQLILAPYLLVDSNDNFDDIELNELTETGNTAEERTDDGHEAVEKLFSAHQSVVCILLPSEIDYCFLYKSSSKSNSHFEVISPPPQFFC